LLDFAVHKNNQIPSPNQPSNQPHQISPTNQPHQISPTNPLTKTAHQSPHQISLQIASCGAATLLAHQIPSTKQPTSRLVRGTI